MATFQKKFVEEWVKEKPGRLFAVQYDHSKEEYVGALIEGGKSVSKVRKGSFAAIHVAISTAMSKKAKPNGTQVSN